MSNANRVVSYLKTKLEPALQSKFSEALRMTYKYGCVGYIEVKFVLDCGSFVSELPDSYQELVKAIARKTEEKIGYPVFPIKSGMVVTSVYN